jgi:hypothetical protein
MYKIVHNKRLKTLTVITLGGFTVLQLQLQRFLFKHFLCFIFILSFSLEWRMGLRM